MCVTIIFLWATLSPDMLVSVTLLATSLSPDLFILLLFPPLSVRDSSLNVFKGHDDGFVYITMHIIKSVGAPSPNVQFN